MLKMKQQNWARWGVELHTLGSNFSIWFRFHFFQFRNQTGLPFNIYLIDSAGVEFLSKDGIMCAIFICANLNKNKKRN